ncbi:hypothetical protein NDU88_001668 [Pleurodeles waltl]|uniref:Uncharacterized protein n=1 Tax=Pleurodeles waltl TaxID=8319 RepID=A0AAV7WJ45_PLEWA|nr:hypothetical protein NDU88_001668 [Pleurodeles waltl]
MIKTEVSCAVDEPVDGTLDKVGFVCLVAPWIWDEAIFGVHAKILVDENTSNGFVNEADMVDGFNIENEAVVNVLVVPMSEEVVVVITCVNLVDNFFIDVTTISSLLFDSGSVVNKLF